MLTTNDTHRTEWSLPGQDDLPRDTLQAQLEVYSETILLRGFEADRNWVRTVSADEIANVFIRHLGFSSGLLPDNALWWNQGETGQVVALWRPPQVWPAGPATGGLPAARPPPAAHARAGLRLLARPRALGLRRPGTAHRLRAAALPRPMFQRLPRRADLSRQPPLPRGGGTDTRIFLPVLLLPYRRYQGPVEETSRQPASIMGGIGWTV